LSCSKVECSVRSSRRLSWLVKMMPGLVLIRRLEIAISEYFTVLAARPLNWWPSVDWRSLVPDSLCLVAAWAWLRFLILNVSTFNNMIMLISSLSLKSYRLFSVNFSTDAAIR